jgi:hypothetical protein
MVLSFNPVERQLQLAERQRKIQVLLTVPKYSELAQTMQPEDWDRCADTLKHTGTDLDAIVKEAEGSVRSW